MNCKYIVCVCIAILYTPLVQGNSLNCTSSSNKTDLFTNFNSGATGHAIFSTLLILNVLILIGNPTTILVIAFKEKKPYDILILGLAVFDTLTGLIPLPITNYNYYYYLYVNKTEVEQSYFISGGRVGCSLYGWSALTFKSGSMLILAIIPFERLLAINFPFWYKKRVKLWKMGLVLLAAVIFSAFHSLLPAIPGISAMKPYGTQKSYCHFEYDDPNNIGSVVYTYFIQIYGYGLVVTASFCYLLLIVSIIQFLVRRRKYTARHGDVSRKKREFLLSLKFMLILLLFNLGWLPFLVSLTFRTILSRCSPHENFQSILEFLGVRIAVLNSVINPIVYVLLMQSYRHGYKVLFGTCCYWITCRKFSQFKPDKNHRDEYLSRSLNQKTKEVRKTFSFNSEYRIRQRSLNNSRENVSIVRQESLLAFPRYSELGYNSGKSSVASLQPTDIGGIFHYIPGSRSDVTSFPIREIDENNPTDHTTIEKKISESPSMFTIASQSTIHNSSLPRDYTRDSVVSPLSGSHWSYSYYINEVALDQDTADLTTDRDSVYSGIPGYNFAGIEDSAELTAIYQKSDVKGDLNECYSNSNEDKLLELEYMKVDKELATEIFANQSVEQQDRPYRLSNTIPHSYKPQSMQQSNLELFPKKKLMRTSCHEPRGEIRTPQHLRILQLDNRAQRRPVNRGQSNPLEPLREVTTYSNYSYSSNLPNSTSVPLKLSDLHSLKLSQSNSQLQKASLSPQNSNCIFSPTNLSVNSGDTGYASSKVTAAGVPQQSVAIRNSSFRQSFQSVVGFANNMKKKVSKSKSTDFQHYRTDEV